MFAQGACLVDPAIGAAGDIDTAKIAAAHRVRHALALISNSRRSGYGYDQRIEAFGSGGMVRAGNVTESEVATLDRGGRGRRPPFQQLLPRPLRRRLPRRRWPTSPRCWPAPRPPSTYADGLAALALAEAAAQSVRTGRPVKV